MRNKLNEENMYFAWIFHDSTKCVRCRARVKLFYEWHYGLRQVMESGVE